MYIRKPGILFCAEGSQPALQCGVRLMCDWLSRFQRPGVQRVGAGERQRARKVPLMGWVPSGS